MKIIKSKYTKAKPVLFSKFSLLLLSLSTSISSQACTRDYWDTNNLIVSRFCRAWDGKELRKFDETAQSRALLGGTISTPNRKATFSWDTGETRNLNAPGYYSVNDTRPPFWHLKDTDNRAGKGLITRQYDWPRTTYNITCGSGNINIQYIGEIFKFRTYRHWSNFEVTNSGRGRKYGGETIGEWYSDLGWNHLNNRYVQPQNHGGPSNCYQ